MTKRIKTKFTGVYKQISSKRKHKNKPDFCLYITYRVGNKLNWEKVGWASEGYSAQLASNIRNERVQQIRHGHTINPKNNIPTFKEAAKKYLEWAKNNRARNGLDDISRYKNHLSPPFDNLKLNEISPLRLEQLKNELTKKGLSNATVKHILIIVRQIYNKMTAWKLYSGENPVKSIKLPNVENKRTRFLSKEEAKTLLSEISKTSEQLHDICLTSLLCGLRAGEIFNLQMQHLDFENKRIIIANPKNNETRMAYMGEKLQITLKKYHDPSSPNDYVFKNSNDGRKLNEVSGTFKRTVKKLGFNEDINDNRQKVVFHTLRHTFASWLAMQGESLLTIADLLGHKDISMVRRYAHLSPDHRKAAALKVESKIFD